MIVAFPYSQGETGAGVSKHKSKGHLISQKDVEQSGGVKCLQQNLNICFIFCCLNKQLADENVKFSSKIVQYLDRESRGSFEVSLKRKIKSYFQVVSRPGIIVAPS
jgi:hypothetical protein